MDSLSCFAETKKSAGHRFFGLSFFFTIQISTQRLSYVCFNQSKLILLRCFIESCNCFYRALLVFLVCLDLKEIRYNNFIFSLIC